MASFEPGPSGIESNCNVNYATTATLQILFKIALSLIYTFAVAVDRARAFPALSFSFR